jgi:hypothetical protein
MDGSRRLQRNESHTPKFKRNRNASVISDKKNVYN